MLPVSSVWRVHPSITQIVDATSSSSSASNFAEMSSYDEIEFYNLVMQFAKELPFSGSPDDNVSEFFAAFEDEVWDNDWLPCQQLALFKCLTGEAEEWFRENHLEITFQKCIRGVRKVKDANGVVTPPFSLQEWEDFVDSFFDRFERKRTNCSTAHPYFSCRKRPDGSWRDYAFTVGHHIDSLYRESCCKPGPLDIKIAMTLEKMPQIFRQRLEPKTAADWSDFLRLVQIEEEQMKASDFY